MKLTLVSLQCLSFQSIIEKTQVELRRLGYSENIEIHSLTMQELTPTSTKFLLRNALSGTVLASKTAIDAELLIADRFHCEIHLDTVIDENKTIHARFTGLDITIVDAESDSAGTTDNVDVHRHYSFDGSSETLADSKYTAIVEAVLDAIAEIDGI